MNSEVRKVTKMSSKGSQDKTFPLKKHEKHEKHEKYEKQKIEKDKYEKSETIGGHPAPSTDQHNKQLHDHIISIVEKSEKRTKKEMESSTDHKLQEMKEYLTFMMEKMSEEIKNVKQELEDDKVQVTKQMTHFVSVVNGLDIVGGVPPKKVANKRERQVKIDMEKSLLEDPKKSQKKTNVMQDFRNLFRTDAAFRSMVTNKHKEIDEFLQKNSEKWEKLFGEEKYKKQSIAMWPAFEKDLKEQLRDDIDQYGQKEDNIELTKDDTEPGPSKPSKPVKQLKQTKIQRLPPKNSYFSVNGTALSDTEEDEEGVVKRGFNMKKKIMTKASSNISILKCKHNHHL